MAYTFGDSRLPDRFWAKVLPVVETGCWVWTAATYRHGYGLFNVTKGSTQGAHRYAYEALVAPVPVELDLDHLCRVPSCVNPLHLEPVSHRENLMRGESFSAVNAVKTHCPKGHPFAGANLAMRWSVDHFSRRCRTCMREFDRNRRPRKRVAR